MADGRHIGECNFGHNFAMDCMICMTLFLEMQNTDNNTSQSAKLSKDRNS